jgi:hypothetical protein
MKSIYLNILLYLPNKINGYVDSTTCFGFSKNYIFLKNTSLLENDGSGRSCLSFHSVIGCITEGSLYIP